MLFYEFYLRIEVCHGIVTVLGRAYFGLSSIHDWGGKRLNLAEDKCWISLCLYLRTDKVRIAMNSYRLHSLGLKIT